MTPFDLLLLIALLLCIYPSKILCSSIFSHFLAYHIQCGEEGSTNYLKSYVCSHKTCKDKCGSSYFKRAKTTILRRSHGGRVCDCIIPNTYCHFFNERRTRYTISDMDNEASTTMCVPQTCMYACSFLPEHQQKLSRGIGSADYDASMDGNICRCVEKSKTQEIVPEGTPIFRPHSLKKKIHHALKWSTITRQKYPYWCFQINNDDSRISLEKRPCTNKGCSQTCGFPFRKGRISLREFKRRPGVVASLQHSTEEFCECIIPNTLCQYLESPDSYWGLRTTNECDETQCIEACNTFGHEKIMDGVSKTFTPLKDRRFQCICRQAATRSVG